MTLILLLLLSEHLNIIDITDSCRRLKSARITRPEIPTYRQPVRQRTRLISFSFYLLLSLVKLVSINLMVVFITRLFVLSADFLHSILVIAVILLLLIIYVSFVDFLIVVYFIFFFVCGLLLVLVLL